MSRQITTRSGHGALSDPAGGKITIVPHTLANNGNTVNYRPCTYYSGSDSFGFVGNDGGTPPQGGDSDPATVTIDVTNVAYTTFEIETNRPAPWPMQTSYEDSRTQVIYLSSEIGGPKTITALALNVHDRPGQDLKYWTIRMKHTRRYNYNSQPFFETSGWTTVYWAHEPRPTTGWYQFDFKIPFKYNGADNLLIDFSHDNNNYSSNGMCLASRMGGERVLMSYADSTHGDPLYWNDFSAPGLWISSDVPNIRLKSEVSGTPIVGDFEPDCNVDIIDLVILCDAWLSGPGDSNWNPACDISQPADNFINERDFAVFAENWLEETE